MSQAIAGLRARARRHFIGLFAACAAVIAGGCGGGGGEAGDVAATPDTPMVYGTAAQGAALDGTVRLKDSTGRVLSTPLSAGSGEFLFSVAGLQPPFVLRATSADGRTVLHSAASAAGRVNITPLTHVALMRLAALHQLAGPADLYERPDRFADVVDATGLRDAAAAALGRLLPAFVAALPGAQPVTPPAYDPFASPFQVGDAVDRLLDRYPLHITVTSAGVETATQADLATGTAVTVLRGDTAAGAPVQLTILGAGDAVVAGTSTALVAHAMFPGGVSHPVPVSWTVAGAGEVRADGVFVAPDVATATPFTVLAHWSDGVRALSATAVVRVVPTMRPVSVSFTGLEAGTLLGNGVATFVPQVLWSDGTVTSPTVEWRWEGDASAVLGIAPSGRLTAGAPAEDQPVKIIARFAHEGVAVEATRSIVVSRQVRSVVSVAIDGFSGGTTLLAGTNVQLSAIARWNDGSEAPVPVVWRVRQTGGVAGRIAVQVSPGGALVSAPVGVRVTDAPTARSADGFAVTATYTGADGAAEVTAAFEVRPVLQEPMSLVLRGAVRVHEGDSSRYQVFVRYADGTEEESVASWSSSDPAMLVPVDTGAFRGGTYTDKPTVPTTVRVKAMRALSYRDAADRQVDKALMAELDVEILWREPDLRSMSFASDFDFVDSGAVGTRVQLTGLFTKLGREYRELVSNVQLTVDNDRVRVDGSSLTVVAAPAGAAQRWVGVTASARSPGGSADVLATRRVTIDRAALVPKRLLGVPWTPERPSTQFRAIASTGQLLDYDVSRETNIYGNGFNSPATVRRVPFLGGLTDFVQSEAVEPGTSYAAAVSFGEVMVARVFDLYDDQRRASPAVLPNRAPARAVALVFRRASGNVPAAQLLYVLNDDGVVDRLALPPTLDRALQAADVVHELTLPGRYTAISAGAEHVLFLQASGDVWAEGSNARGQLGHPSLGPTGWHALTRTRAVTYDDGRVPTESDLVATLTRAERNFSLAADTTHLRGWGEIESAWGILLGVNDTSDERAAMATRLHTVVGPARALTRGAVVNSDGTVSFRMAAFTSSGYEGRDLWSGGGRYYARADWLPPVRDIAPNRRQPAAWPHDREDDLAPMMPIVRTETDHLLYLDGLPIVDAAGAALFIP